MNLLVKGSLGLLSLGAAVGTGFGLSYLHSGSSEENVLPNNWRWLGLGDGDDTEEWEKKVFSYKSGNVKLDNYDPKEGVQNQDSNISKMKAACKLIREGDLKNLGGKLEQAKSWCSAKKKVRDMFDNKDRWLLFDTFEQEDSNSEWHNKLEKNLKENNRFNVSPWSSNTSDKVKNINAMKEKCEKLMVEDVEDGKANVALFETWCISSKPL